MEHIMYPIAIIGAILGLLFLIFRNKIYALKWYRIVEVEDNNEKYYKVEVGDFNGSVFWKTAKEFYSPDAAIDFIGDLKSKKEKTSRVVYTSDPLKSRKD